MNTVRQALEQTQVESLRGEREAEAQVAQTRRELRCAWATVELLRDAIVEARTDALALRRVLPALWSRVWEVTSTPSLGPEPRRSESRDALLEKFARSARGSLAPLMENQRLTPFLPVHEALERGGYGSDAPEVALHTLETQLETFSALTRRKLDRAAAKQRELQVSARQLATQLASLLTQNALLRWRVEQLERILDVAGSRAP